MATIPRNRQIHKRLLIARPDGTTWVDVADYLASIEVELGSIEQLGTGTGSDIGVRSISFELRNAPGKCFAPKDKTSEWNLVNGEWVPLLWPYREVVFQTAITAPGVHPSSEDWLTGFEGYLGDGTTADHHRVTANHRDKSKLLQDTYIDVEKTYEGPISAENLIQQIITDYVPDSPPSLYSATTGITFEKMKVEYASVWDAIQNIATQIGWFLGYRWNGTQYVLTLFEPPRGKAFADFELDWEDVILNQSLEIGDKEIRNALTISYRDGATGERVTLRHTDHPRLRNQASIDEYRLRAMQIEEADTSLIDTQEKALSFGELCIWDLSELSTTNRITLPYLPEIDLFSTLRVTNPLISSTADFYAVQSVRHTLKFNGDKSSFRTEIIATGRVVGARKRWLDMETRPGRPGDPKNQGPPGEPGKDGEINVPIPADPAWGGYALTNALRLTWRKAEHASGYEIRDNLDWGSASGMLFTGYAHEFSFIPTEREMILYLRALNAIGEYSEGYDTLEVSLPAPVAPDQPHILASFRALQITVEPLGNPAVIGYTVYVTEDGNTIAIPTVAGQPVIYTAEPNTALSVQVAARDIVGEGPKSEPLQAITIGLSDLDAPPGGWTEEALDPVIKERIDVSELLATQTGLRVDNLRVNVAYPKPPGSVLVRFDDDLNSTDGQRPAAENNATVAAGAGKHSGAAVIQPGGVLAYDVTIEDSYTVTVYRATATWNDYADMTWTQLDEMEV